MKICFVIISCAFLFSCTKDKGDILVNAPVINPLINFFPLTVGNYWVYEIFTIDTNNNETLTGTDSVYVSKDTIINENIYYKIIGSLFCSACISYRRDSVGYIVDSYGKKWFSWTNFTDTLQIYSIPGYSITFFKMAHKDSSVSLPIGIFNTYDVEKITYFNNPSYSWGNPRYAHNFYAQKIGLIKEREYYDNSPEYIERRLIRYYIK